MDTILAEVNAKRLAMLFASLLLILGAQALMAKPANATHKYFYEDQWGSEGTKAGEFMVPYGLTMGQTDNVYVLDPQTLMVQIFQPDGTFISRFGVTKGDPDYFIGDLAVDATGDVLITDVFEGKIYKYSAAGTFLEEWTLSGGFFATPFGIDVDDTGDVWVTSMFESTIHKLDAAGNELMSFGSEGEGDGELLFPSDVELSSSGRLYVVDSYNNRVQWFDPSDGTYLGQHDAGPVGVDNFWDSPMKIATSDNGDVFLTISNGTIQRFDSAGNLKDEWGGRGRSNGRFLQPLGIGLASDGTVYATDLGNSRVQYFKRSAHTPSNLTIYSRWGAVDYGGWNKLAGFLTDSDNNPLANRYVNIRVRKAIADPWSWVATKMTDSNGYYQHWFKPRISGPYKAYFGGEKGNSNTWSGRARIIVREGLTVQNPLSTITYGGWTYMPGVLMSGSGGVSGKQVYLQKWDPFGKVWRWESTRTTDSRGEFVFWIKATETRYYRVHKDPSVDTSRVLKRVRPQTVLRASSTNVEPGRSVKFTGWINPSHPGHLAYVQWYDSSASKWQWARTITLTNKAFTMFYDPAGKGPQGFRLYYPGHWDHAANTSSTVWINFQ